MTNENKTITNGLTVGALEQRIQNSELLLKEVNSEIATLKKSDDLKSDSVRFTEWEKDAAASLLIIQEQRSAEFDYVKSINDLTNKQICLSKVLETKKAQREKVKFFLSMPCDVEKLREVLTLLLKEDDIDNFIEQYALIDAKSEKLYIDNPRILTQKIMDNGEQNPFFSQSAKDFLAVFSFFELKEKLKTLNREIKGLSDTSNVFKRNTNKNGALENKALLNMTTATDSFTAKIRLVELEQRKASIMSGLRSYKADLKALSTPAKPKTVKPENKTEKKE